MLFLGMRVSCAVSYDCSFRRFGLGCFYDSSLIAKPMGFKDFSVMLVIRLHTHLPHSETYMGQPKNKQHFFTYFFQALCNYQPNLWPNGLEQLASFWEASGLRH